MTYQAIPGHILVDILPHEEKYGSLFVVTNTELPLRGKVVSVGSEHLNRKGQVVKRPCKEGDVVHFKRYTPKSLEHYGRDGMKKGLASIWFDEVLAVE